MPDETLGQQPVAAAQQTSQTQPSFASQVESAEQQTPAVFDIRARLAGDGYELEGFDDDRIYGAIKHSLGRAARADELEPLEAQARRYLDHADEIEEFLASRQKQAQAQQPAAPAKPNPWKAPIEYDPEWEKFTTYDQNLGRYVLREEAQRYVSPKVAEQLNQFKQWERERSQHIVRNFPDAVNEAVAEKFQELYGNVQKYVQEYAQQRQTQSQVMAEAQQFIADHYKDFFVTDANGNVMVDAAGREAFTQKGAIFNHFAQQLAQCGMQDGKLIRQHALNATEIEMGKINAAAKAAKKEEKAAEKEAAAPGPSTQPPTPAERNAVQKESFIARHVKEARKPGVAVPSAEAEEAALKSGRKGVSSFAQLRKEEFAKAGFNDN